MKLRKRTLAIAMILSCVLIVGCSNSKTPENYKKDLSSYMQMNEYVSYAQLDMFEKTTKEIESAYKYAYDEISNLNMMTQEGKNIQEKYIELVKYAQTNLGKYCNDEDQYNKAAEEMMSNDEKYIALVNEVNKLQETMEKSCENM